MRRTLPWLLLGAATLAISTHARAADPPRFEWKDGDRVVLVGDTFIERDQRYGYLETLITARNPDKSITFRNLGWSGDTVRGLSRAAFDPPPEGYRRLKEHVLALKPTVLIVDYGMAESFDGAAGLPRFVEGLKALLDLAAAIKARVVMLSPIMHESLGPPLPDPRRHNADLKLYRDAIETLAGSRGHPFVDLYRGVQTTAYGNYTDDGIHPTELGYWSAALVASSGLGVSLPGWSVALDGGGSVVEHRGTELADVKASPGSLRFRASDRQLPYPLPPIPWRRGVLLDDRTLHVNGLDQGRYTIRIDGKAAEVIKPDGRTVAAATAEELAAGVAFYRTPERDQVESLRRAIVEKNALYFYRWRPQNETYLFGFRKHEQGNNAREIPEFDPLIEAKEQEIARLRRPVSHVYELTRGQSEALK